jgi:hypothetical protein
VTEAARWWGRFENGASYIELTLRGRMVRNKRGDTLHEELDSASRYETDAEAVEMVKRLSTNAVAAGYRLAREGEPAIERAVNVELEGECLAEPENPGPWGVYADWLIAQGDVRGELAALRAAGKGEDADRLLQAKRTAVFGVNADSWAKLVECTWTHGFLSGVRLSTERANVSMGWRNAPVCAEIVEELLAMPIARFVQAIQLESADRESVVAIEASVQARTLRELRIEQVYEAVLPWAKFPALEVLEIAASYGIEEVLAHDRLRRLAITRWDSGYDQLAVIADARCPRLEELEVRLGGLFTGRAPIEQLNRLFHTTTLPALRHLGLPGCEYVDSVLTALAKSPLVQRLRVLDLSDGDAAGPEADALIARADALQHLERIDVDNNRFTPQQLAKLARVLPNVHAGEQRLAGEPVVEREPMVARRRTRRAAPSPVMPTRRRRT